MRHPCGQVASLLAERAQREVATSGDLAVQLMAVATAERAGLAWCSITFNESVVDVPHDLPNARIVTYDDLRRRREAFLQTLLLFSGSAWHPQTAPFLDGITWHDRATGFFAASSSTGLAADR